MQLYDGNMKDTGHFGKENATLRWEYEGFVIALASRSAGRPGQNGRMRVPKMMKTLVFFEFLIREIVVVRVLGGGAKHTGSKVLRILSF